MASVSNKTICFICKKEKITYPCQGCSQNFCLDDLPKHRQNLSQELDQIQNDYDQFRQNLHDQTANLLQHPFIKQIDQWEIDTINDIKRTAQQLRQSWINHSKAFFVGIETKFNHLAQQIRGIHRENEFNEIDLNHLKQKLEKLQEELDQPIDIPSEQQPSLPITDDTSLRLPFHKNTRWKQSAITIAGGNGQGERLDQITNPQNICIDDHDQCIYIADYTNHRIVEWKLNATTGRIVAGGNGKGNRLNELNCPRDVILDRADNSIIIADRDNRRVVRWSRQASSQGQVIISNINCARLALHEDGSLYVSDYAKHEVRQWKKGEKQGTIVAGGNGKGNQLNQLNTPTHLFVDRDHTLYVSDYHNHRVMKWVKGAKEGVVVVNGSHQRVPPIQLFYPGEVVVDQFGQIYVANCSGDYVMRLCEGAKEGTIVVGGNGKGKQANQLNSPVGLSFDSQGNLYVADYWNDRIQKFEIE